MEPNRLTTRAMLQRVVTLTKHAHELQASSSLNVPFWNRQPSTNSNSDFYLLGNGSQSPHGPTYTLVPTRKFDFSRAQRLLQFELNRRCSRIPKTFRYDPKQCLDLVRDLSQQLRRVIKPDVLNHIRYKIIVLVSIVQTTPDRQIHQSMTIVSRCLWNQETDGSVTVQTKLGFDMLATATAFAIYTD